MRPLAAPHAIIRPMANALTIPTASSIGIIPNDPLRNDAIFDLHSGTKDKKKLLDWLDRREREANAANVSVANIGLTIDLATIYEDAGSTQAAGDAYRAAREAARNEGMDGVVRSLEEKLRLMYTLGYTETS
jgi:hypothetical protein